MPFGKNQYIKSLEQRVAELESCLAERGIPEPGSDHWQKPQQSSGSTREQSIQLAPDHSHGEETSADSVSGEDVHEWQKGVDSVVGVLKDLSLDANGGYMGASSHFSVARLLETLVKERKAHAATTDIMQYQTSNSPSIDVTEEDEESDIVLRNIPPTLADRLLVGYIKHISTRWPILHSAWVRELHGRRTEISDVYEHHVLHLVYAIGGRFLETAGDRGDFQPELHYQAALKHLNEVLQYRDTRSVCCLLLLAVWALRAAVGPGAWVYSRMALMHAVDLGLHRQPPGPQKVSVQNEMRKRIFWACYAFDRQISIPLGRPFALSDRDIDAALPLDIDEDCTDVEPLAQVAGEASNTAPAQSTSLSSFIHVVRLRRIESDIQQTIYRVDETTDLAESVIDDFLNKLAKWKDSIPLDTKRKIDIADKAFVSPRRCVPRKA